MTKAIMKAIEAANEKESAVTDDHEDILETAAEGLGDERDLSTRAEDDDDLHGEQELDLQDDLSADTLPKVLLPSAAHNQGCIFSSCYWQILQKL
jgi:hypothetical protein